MSPLLFTQLFSLIALIFALAALAVRIGRTRALPFTADRATAKGSPQRGVFYAFTLGMAPWAKESTRRHILAYLRGIGFHVGIFGGLVALLISPMWSRLPQFMIWILALFTLAGAFFGMIGDLMRWFSHPLRELSTLDDHAAVLLVSLFMGLTGMALINSSWMPSMYVSAALMFIYVPLGKIRHCIYFFFSRRFFGSFIGKRGVIHSEVAQ